LCIRSGAGILRSRIGENAAIQAVDYSETITIGAAKVSLHPAGHILGSAQVRIEVGGRVAVISGDYKTDADPTCTPFEPLCCHLFVTESTFGLPVFRWPKQERVLSEINSWWHDNRRENRTSVLFAYSLGKAQRVLAGIDRSIGPIFVHGAVARMNRCYRDAGIDLPATRPVGDAAGKHELAGALVVAPPSADAPAWLRRFSQPARALVSGWMQIRGNRRRRAFERGFVLSDHSDWDGLMGAIEGTSAHTVAVTHGYSAELVRLLQEKGQQAFVLPTRFAGEIDDAADNAQDTDRGP
jgi:putative mRNA 3-end processing factor